MMTCSWSKEVAGAQRGRGPGGEVGGAPRVRTQ